MALTHRLFLLVGVVATTTGPTVVVGVSFGLELTDTFLGLVAALAAFWELQYAQHRRDAPSNTTVADDPEARISVPISGADFDDDLVFVMGQSTHWVARERVADRLEMRVKEALVANGSHAPEEVAAPLRTGGQTDDPVAAYFFGASVSTPFRQHVRLPLPGRSLLTDRAEQAVAVIEQIGTADDPVDEHR